jgi:WD40 repeat protein
MSERPDDARERQQRLDALRGLAQTETAPAAADAPTAAPPATPPTLGERTGVSPRPRSSTARRFWRRWRALALVVVAAVVIFGVVIGAILQNSGLRLGSKPPPALVNSVISLSAAGSFSCPSAPVWSPDGKQLAVIAGVGAAPNGCPGFSEVTSIAQSSNGESISGPPPDTFAVVIFDAASGHVVRSFKLPNPSASVLCAGADPCGVTNTTLESLGWSPDGRSIAIFGLYTFEHGTPSDLTSQARGLLIVAPVRDAGAPRVLIATGRTVVVPDSSDLKTTDFYSPPRFTWDLTSGSATYADIQRGQGPATVPLAAGYRLGADGALAMEQQAQAGDTSPWRQGVLVTYTAQGAAHSTVRYVASQWLWSPDSRYVTPHLNNDAYLSIQGMTVTPPSDNSGLIPEPIISPPDAALAQAVKAAISAHGNVGLARNPDGKLLAALLCAPSGAGQLTIRNVASGQMVAQADHSYPLTSTSLGCAGDLSAIAWSPDGARIASSDGPDGQIIVWQVNVRA